MKNLKSQLQMWDLVRTSHNEIYEVLYLGDDYFQCRNVAFIGSDMERIELFPYTTNMIIFKEHARNVPT